MSWWKFIPLCAVCSDHQHETANKTVERLVKDYERTSHQLDAVLEDLTNAEIVYDLKQRELNRQQETCFNDESSVKVCLFSVYLWNCLSLFMDADGGAVRFLVVVLVAFNAFTGRDSSQWKFIPRLS